MFTYKSLSRKDLYTIVFSVLVSALLSISHSYVGEKLTTNRIKEIHLYFNLIGRELYSVFKRGRLGRQTKKLLDKVKNLTDKRADLKILKKKFWIFKEKKEREKIKHVFSNTNEEEKGCGSKHPSFCAS